MSVLSDTIINRVRLHVMKYQDMTEAEANEAINRMTNLEVIELLSHVVWQREIAGGEV